MSAYDATDTKDEWANFGTLSQPLEAILKKDELKKTALHLKSETHKLFAIDLDLDDRHVSGHVCTSEEDDLNLKICPRCWKTLWLCAGIVENALKNLYEHTVLKCKYKWVPPLVCLSGNRGMHIYMHHESGMHLLPEQFRKQIVTHLISKWKAWIDPELAVFLKGLDFERLLPRQMLPIDANASFSCSKNLRCVFSPHLKTKYACTPVYVIKSGLEIAHRIDSFELNTIESKGIAWDSRLCGDPSNLSRFEQSLHVFKAWLESESEKNAEH